MKILYHHRTRATDAQRVHILEIVSAFRGLGHKVILASLVKTEVEQHDARKDAEEAAWKKLIRRIPLAYEFVQLAYNFVAFPWLLWKVYRTRPEFIYERYSLLNFSGVLAARISHRPIVLEVNSPFALEQHQQREIRAVRFAQWMERRICNAATKVIVVSGPLRRILIRNGVMESKLAVLPNGVNLRHLRSAGGNGELRESLELNGRVVIGFAGWFRKWHGLEFLIEAFGKSDLARRGAALLLIGDGPAMPELRRIVEERGLQGSVVFTGPVPHERIPPYLDMIDIAVQPAANEYCCPVKVLEYMALAKPIVAPRQENIEELLEDGHTGQLFQPGDGSGLSQALSGLIDDVDRRRAMGAKALGAIQERGLLWDRNAQAVVDMVG